MGEVVAKRHDVRVIPRRHRAYGLISSKIRLR